MRLTTTSANCYPYPVLYWVIIGFHLVPRRISSLFSRIILSLTDFWALPGPNSTCLGEKIPLPHPFSDSIYKSKFILSKPSLTMTSLERRNGFDEQVV